MSNLNIGQVRLTAQTELTIASGAISPTQALHTVDTESDASSDDLDTINTSEFDHLSVAGVTYRPVIYLLAENSGRTVTVKHNTGNIKLSGAADVDLSVDNPMMLIYNGSNWVDLK